jgi:hypothetical protein
MPDPADPVRGLEVERLAAFVARDMQALERLHAEDFSLINPAGVAVSKDEYIRGIAAGFIEYKAWEPEGEIEARVYDEAAVLRYRSRVEIVVQRERQPEQRFWEIVLYEQRDGRWQAVFSQATRVSP